MKALILCLLPCACLAQHPLTTASGIDWTTSSSAVFSDWANRVQTNGGARPSAQSITAVNTFLNGLTNDGLNNLVISFNVMAPDSLIACQTPVYVGGGSDPWVNQNFVSGDLTVDGLKGDGTTKSLKTGLKPSTCGWTVTDGGMTIYEFTTNSTGVDFGIQEQSATTRSSLALTPAAATAVWDSWNFTAGQGQFVATVTTNGYLSGNRTAANAIAIYFANSKNAHSAVLTGNTTGGNISSQTDEIYCFALDLVNPIPAAAIWSNARISFFAIHHGLNATQSANFYARIQQLRIDLGGGAK